MALRNMNFAELEYGFFRCIGSGRIFFATQHGKWTFSFPVKDGQIQGNGGEIFSPYQEIEVFPKEEWVNFGLNEIMVSNFAGR